jgi:hypothetical protein
MVTITWDPPANAAAYNIVGYKVSWRYPISFNSGASAKMKLFSKVTFWQSTVGWNDIGTISGNSVTISTIDPKREFIVKVCSIDANGNTSYATKLPVFLLKPDNYPGICNNFNIKRADEKKIELSWEYTDTVAPVKYEIEYSVKQWMGFPTLQAWRNKSRVDIWKYVNDGYKRWKPLGGTITGKKGSNNITHDFSVDQIDDIKGHFYKFRIRAWTNEYPGEWAESSAYIDGDAGFRKRLESFKKELDAIDADIVANKDAKEINKRITEAQKTLDTANIDISNFMNEFFSFLTPRQQTDIEYIAQHIVPELQIRTNDLATRVGGGTP